MYISHCVPLPPFQFVCVLCFLMGFFSLCWIVCFGPGLVPLFSLCLFSCQMYSWTPVCYLVHLNDCKFILLIRVNPQSSLPPFVLLGPGIIEHYSEVQDWEWNCSTCHFYVGDLSLLPFTDLQLKFDLLTMSTVFP